MNHGGNIAASCGGYAGQHSADVKPSAPLTANEFYRGEINQDIGALRVTLSNLSSSAGLKLDKDLFFQAHAALNIAETLLAKAIQ